MSDEMAYTIVKTLFDKKAELVAVHKEAKNIDLKNQADRLADPVPSGRAQVLRGAGRQGQLTRGRRAAAGVTDIPSANGGTGTASGRVAQTDARRSPRIACARPRAFIEEEEGATSRIAAARGHLATVLLVGMSLFHLYAAVEIVPAQILRPVHVGWTLLLVFLLFPIAAALSQSPDVVGRDPARCSALRRSRTCSPVATTSGTATRCRIVSTSSSAWHSCCSCWRPCGARPAGSCCS